MKSAAPGRGAAKRASAIINLILALSCGTDKDFPKVDSSSGITELLLALAQGDQSARERLMPLVEQELRRIARSYLRKEKNGQSLQTTDLVDQAYLRLIDQKRVHWQNRNHFFAIAATCMRRILCDKARTEGRKKRGGGVGHVALSDAPPVICERSAELLALDEALEQLARQDARKSQIVEMRFFGGYSVEEVAGFLELSVETAALEWRMARAWLKRQLSVNQDS